MGTRRSSETMVPPSSHIGAQTQCTGRALQLGVQAHGHLDAAGEAELEQRDQRTDLITVAVGLDRDLAQPFHGVDDHAVVVGQPEAEQAFRISRSECDWSERLTERSDWLSR